MNVKILIDSASDISAVEAAELGVELVPMEVTFEDGQYLDGVDLTPELFYAKLARCGELPKTSQINEFTFEKIFAELTEKGFDVVAITISSKLSGTYGSAASAAKRFSGKVFAVDSLTACIGERLLCQYALRLVAEGLSAAEIAKRLDTEKTKINLLALLDTLRYLKKGGRISAAAAIAGQLLSVKPVFGVVDGEVKLLGKAMGSKNGNNLLNKLLTKKRINFDMPFGVIYSGADDALLRKYVKDSEHLWKYGADALPAYSIGCTIGTHVGPGAIGVAFFATEE